MATKAKVLLAEDDAALGFIIKDALEEDGYEVVHCADGQTAIDRFNKNEFDICLLDVMMPNKDGFAVAKKIRQSTESHTHSFSYRKIYGGR
ncbi:MAG: response regulator [Chitinophagaceae bacterium]